jgi:hypothetical protein
VLFDMAGTPIEEGGHVPAACGAALAACGLSLSDDQLGNVRGASKREAIGLDHGVGHPTVAHVRAKST